MPAPEVFVGTPVQYCLGPMRYPALVTYANGDLVHLLVFFPDAAGGTEPQVAHNVPYYGADNNHQWQLPQ